MVDYNDVNNNDEEIYHDDFFTVADDGRTKEERKKFVDEIIKNKNEYLLSLGYKIDSNGKIITPNTMMNDGIIGFAIGDALGVPVEFSSRVRLIKHPLKEMIGFGAHLVPEGTWSDDTSMVVATMVSIIDNNGINYNDIMYKFNEWLENGEYSALNTVFDVGKTTKKAILNSQNGIDAILCGGKDINDNGNGSLMRMLPVAYYLNENKFGIEEEIEIVNNVSSLTHAHEISCLGCKIYCDYVKQLLNGVNRSDALMAIQKFDYSKYYSVDSVNVYNRVLSGDISKLSVNDIKSTGYVVDTLEASLWSLLNTSNFEQAVLNAINLGGDTDTIGAITGGLAGIIYGKKQIPKRWLVKLRKREYLEEMSKIFVNALKSDSIGKKR